MILTPDPQGHPYGIDWDRIFQYKREIRHASKEFRVPQKRLEGTIVIESQGNRYAVQKNDSNGWSYGLMQIVPHGVGWDGWYETVYRLAGYRGDATTMLYDPLLNLRVGASILHNMRDTHSTWDRASSAFFLGNPHWIGWDTVNGNSGPRYRNTLRGLIRELRTIETGGSPDEGENGWQQEQSTE